MILLHRTRLWIQSQTSGPSYGLDRDEIPSVHRLHMRGNDIDFLLRISLFSAPPSRMHGLNFIAPQIQSPRPLHLHPHHALLIPTPHHEIPTLAVSPGTASLNPIISAFSRNA